MSLGRSAWILIREDGFNPGQGIWRVVNDAVYSKKGEAVRELKLRDESDSGNHTVIARITIPMGREE